MRQALLQSIRTRFAVPRDADAEQRIAAALRTTTPPAIEGLAGETVEMVFGVDLQPPTVIPAHREHVPPAETEPWQPPALDLSHIAQVLGELATPAGPRIQVDGGEPTGPRPYADLPDESDWRVGWTKPVGRPLEASGARVIEHLVAVPSDRALTQTAAWMLLDGANTELLLVGMRAWERNHRPAAAAKAPDAAPVPASSAVAW